MTNRPVIWTTATVLLVVVLFWPTASSIINIWNVSPTFSHGFLVAPAFLWLVWRRRSTLAHYQAKPDARVLILVAFFGATWFISGLAGIQVGEHASLALMIMCTIWATLGTPVSRVIQFPILFLFFLAPVGEELVPYLMEITADFTVWAIRLSGVPIYREGLFFSLPSGDWSVVEACSGINYLISSISLGSVYAYLSYSSYRKRFLFMIIASLLPILANSVRAYLIVMLGHLSGNKLATGVDHLVYGWVFFGIVMFLLFSIGSLFQSKNDVKPLEMPPNPKPIFLNNGKYQPQAKWLVLVVLSITIWPSWSNLIRAGESELQSEAILAKNYLPQSVSSIENSISSASIWQPRMIGFDARLDAKYESGNAQAVRALAFVYVTQHQGKEMINSSNVLVRSHGEIWRRNGSEAKQITTDSGFTLDIIETTLRSAEQSIIVWQWYSVGEYTTNNSLKVKLRELLNKISLGRRVSTTYLLTTEDTKMADVAMKKAAEKILSN